MLIRSQDKKSLCKYNSGIVTAFEKYDYDVINNKMVPTEIKGYDIFFCDNGREIQIGAYSTEEKTIKVLDMIENACYNFEYSKFLGCENDTFAGCIFQMPQDEEV